MDAYDVHRRIGQGTFGVVYLAVHRKSGQPVAIKRMNDLFPTWEACVQLPEVQALRALHHPNIIQLLQVVRDSNILYLVYECMHMSLLDYMKKYPAPRRDPADVRDITYQIALATAAIHDRQFMHRDIKPENVLLSADLRTVKLADFGQARRHEGTGAYTTAVSTLWYQAPEVLLGLPYGPAMDVWAVGCILGELLYGDALMQGKSALDQMAKMVALLGPPTPTTWPDGATEMRRFGLRPEAHAEHCGTLGKLLGGLPERARLLVQRCLAYNPAARPVADEVLQSPYFCEAPTAMARPWLPAAMETDVVEPSPPVVPASDDSPLWQLVDYRHAGPADSPPPSLLGTSLPWIEPPPLATLLSEMDGLQQLSSNLL